MGARQTNCCCGVACCDCADTPDEWVVDLGAGGWTDRGRCTDCPGAAGEFTLHRVNRTNAGQPLCYWDFHNYNFCFDNDPDVGPNSDHNGPCPDPWGLSIELRIIGFLPAACFYELLIRMSCGTRMDQPKHFFQVELAIGSERCENDVPTFLNCNNPKGQSIWESINRQGGGEFDDCDGVMNFSTTRESHSFTELAPCAGALPDPITVRRA